MRTLLFVVALMYPSSWALAQEHGPELGLGIGGMSLTLSGGDAVFSMNVNEPFVSLAFYTSPKVAVEPSATISFVATEGGTALVTLLGLNVPIYSQETWGRSGFYFSPGLDCHRTP